MSDFIFQTEDGQEVTFSAEQLKAKPEGYLTTDEVEASDEYVKKSFMESEISRRLESRTKKTRKELEQDEEFFKNLAEQKGIKFENGKPKLKSDINIDEVKNELFEKEVKPLKNELNSLYQANKRDAIYKAAVEAGISEELLKPVTEGGQPMIVQLTESNLKRDPNGNWSIPKGEDDFQFASNPTDDRPYAGPKELFEGLKKTNPSWFKDTTQNGSGFGGNKRPGGDKTPKTRAEMTSREKARYINEHGREAFNKIPLK
ncbi:hypothetical protein [Gracilimonas sediminicola]|uniref:Uncharacterized protein n=1 Tax=Gracilimonas sediminicola TaxID=2952158 RepID=A0A9X2L0L1_9BACT|nr:hypothetical protein [Gracilimonas sediminicola]MCP9289997.1 hypothetical protein [Gracilimonas sediminicola]